MPPAARGASGASRRTKAGPQLSSKARRAAGDTVTRGRKECQAPACGRAVSGESAAATALAVNTSISTTYTVEVGNVATRTPAAMPAAGAAGTRAAMSARVWNPQLKQWVCLSEARLSP